MQTPRDENRVPTMLGVSDDDGTTPRSILIDPSSHGLSTDNNITGSDLSGNDAYRDENRVTTMMVVSEVDGTTPVQLYVDSAGALLIDTT